MPDRARRRRNRKHGTGPHLFPGRTPEIRRRRQRDALVIFAFCVLSVLAVYLFLWSPMRM